MFIVFLGFIANQLAASALFFFIVWAVMRKRNGVKLGAGWLIPGILATASIGGITRFAFWVISGGSAGASLGENASLFFFLMLPTLTAIGVCAFLKRPA